MILAHVPKDKKFMYEYMPYIPLWNKLAIFTPYLYTKGIPFWIILTPLILSVCSIYIMVEPKQYQVVYGSIL